MLGIKPMGGNANSTDPNAAKGPNFVPRGPWAELIAARERV